MPRYSSAKWRPISVNYTKTKTAKTRVILHTSASKSLTSLYGWFSNSNTKASSHFHIAFDGTVEQYIDTDHVSWASGEGNNDSISIETQGDGTEKWTNEQITSIIGILRWANKTHGVPLDQMDSSRVGTKGIGWHRLGVDGKWFPSLPSILAGRTQRGGGEKWSSASGKVCPGDLRIQQIPGIIAQAKNTPTTTTTTTTTYTVKSGDTWWSISRHLGMDMNTLISLNNATPNTTLYTGQKLITSNTSDKYVVTTDGLNRRTEPSHTAKLYGDTPLYKGAAWYGTGKNSKDSYGNTWIEGRSDWMLSANQPPAWVNSRYLKKV